MTWIDEKSASTLEIPLLYDDVNIFYRIYDESKIDCFRIVSWDKKTNRGDETISWTNKRNIETNSNTNKRINE